MRWHVEYKHRVYDCYSEEREGECCYLVVESRRLGRFKHGIVRITSVPNATVHFMEDLNILHSGLARYGCL